MNKKNDNNFESALKRLEQISDLLENEDTSLEESIKLFEEGIALKEICEITMGQSPKSEFYNHVGNGLSLIHISEPTRR